MRAVVPASVEYAAWRRRNGRLNFQDLLLIARDLLRDHAHVRRSFQERFLPILVDEFQDTDPIQAEILFYLTGDDPEQRDWRRLVPKPGSLFVVGDPKQSIYRFRRADIETYGAVRDRLAKHGRVLRLTANFRSSGRLCAWVNGVFARRFPAEATPQQAAWVPLAAQKPEGPPGVFLLETRTSGGSVQPVVDQDARRIARTIDALVRKRERRPEDFLVLFRTRKFMSDYARELESHGIPYELSGGGAFRDSEELDDAPAASLRDLRPRRPGGLHGRPARAAVRRGRRGPLPPLPGRRTLLVPRRPARWRRPAHRARLRAPARGRVARRRAAAGRRDLAPLRAARLDGVRGRPGARRQPRRKPAQGDCRRPHVLDRGPRLRKRGRGARSADERGLHRGDERPPREARRRAADDRARGERPRGSGRVPRRPPPRERPSRSFLDRPPGRSGARALAGHPEVRGGLRGQRARRASRLGRHGGSRTGLRRGREDPAALRRRDAREGHAGRQHLEAGQERERAGHLEHPGAVPHRGARRNRRPRRRRLPPRLSRAWLPTSPRSARRPAAAAPPRRGRPTASSP